MKLQKVKVYDYTYAREKKILTGDYYEGILHEIKSTKYNDIFYAIVEKPDRFLEAVNINQVQLIK